MSDAERLQYLWDRAEIEDVLLRYCRGIDRRDEELIRSAYHDDVIEHHGAYRGSGLDDFIGYATARSALFERVCHYICNQLIAIDGDTAHSEAYSIALHQARDGDIVSQTIFGGRYIDRLERRGGRWGIVDRVVVCDWSRVDATDPWPREALFAQAANDRSDVVFDIGTPGPAMKLRARDGAG